MNPTFQQTRLVICSILLTVFNQTGQAQEIPTPIKQPYLAPIELHVDASNLRQKIFNVHERLQVKSGDLTLLYPQWLPGEHGPNGPLVQLASLTILANHTRLEWQRDPVNMYAFHIKVPAGSNTLDLTFQFLSPTNSAQGAVVVTPELLAVQWEKMLLYPAGYFSSGIMFTPNLTLPAGWKYVSALEVASQQNDTIQFKPINMVDLIDSPLYAGKYLNRYDLDPGAKVPVYFDVFSHNPDSGIAKPEQIELHRALLQQAYKLFGSHHFDHYDFLVAASDSFGFDGLEHHQSGENLVSPGYFKDWDKNLAVRGYLIPHEFTHSWDGKFRRPAGQLTANYNQPMQNSLLWVYEGQTEYWGFVLAARSGLLSADQVRDSIAMVAADLNTNAARSWRTLQDTANDPIINNRRPLGWRHWQRSEDYYDEGQMIWLDVDTKIRELSAEQHSLNDFAKQFFGINNGSHIPLPYEFNDIVNALNAIQPFGWKQFLQDRLTGHGPGAPLDGLPRSGWKLIYSETPSDYNKSILADNGVADFWYSLGFTIHKDNKFGEIAWDSPAFKSGLSSHATLLAVNGHEYKEDVLKKAITEAKTSQAAIELLVKTDDLYETIRFNYHDGLKYPRLERIAGTPDRLTAILQAL